MHLFSRLNAFECSGLNRHGYTHVVSPIDRHGCAGNCLTPPTRKSTQEIAKVQRCTRAFFGAHSIVPSDLQFLLQIKLDDQLDSVRFSYPLVMTNIAMV